MADLDRLKEFLAYSYPDEPRVSQEYVLVSPGSYEYLIAPRRANLRWLSNRFAGHSYRRRIASLGVETLAWTRPRFLGHLPGVRICELSVPESCRFDVGVFGRRIKLLNYSQEIVFTIPNQEGENLQNEVRVRREIPEGIHVPEVRQFDNEFPYFAEELLTGYTPSDIVDDWSAILRGLEQLLALYRETTVGFVQTEIILTDTFGRMAETELADDPLFERTRSFLNATPLPERIRRSQIHHDFQTGNLLVSNGDTYVLDWESSRVDLCLLDVFNVFKRYSIESDGGGPLTELVRCNGEYREIANDIATRLGPVVYDHETYYHGLPVLYTLLTLTHGPGNAPSQDHFAYDLLAALLADIT